MLRRIFDKIRDSPSTTEYEVKVSYMEIYMEKIHDLLSGKPSNAVEILRRSYLISAKLTMIYRKK